MERSYITNLEQKQKNQARDRFQLRNPDLTRIQEARPDCFATARNDSYLPVILNGAIAQ
jgi:hypothetical protein